jgi:hypothetical protein
MMSDIRLAARITLGDLRSLVSVYERTPARATSAVRDGVPSQTPGTTS